MYVSAQAHYCDNIHFMNITFSTMIMIYSIILLPVAYVFVHKLHMLSKIHYIVPMSCCTDIRESLGSQYRLETSGWMTLESERWVGLVHMTRHQ